ncbi:MAG: site-2 protease family protein [Methanomassiliicoccus sp.]|nr:site-2 protease family protein [Methanomassiliicoccus sp.]
MDGLLIALLIIAAYLVVAVLLNKKGILAKFNMTMWGPFIMWRTSRGRDLIDKLAKPSRFWKAYAALGKGIIIVVMVAIMALLVWEAFLVSNIPAEQAPSLDMLIGLPGINPIIPIGYGILGLVVAVVIHEFAHGILTVVGKMKVKALGIVFLVLPMGAFVEPDEEALEKVEKKKRTSVYVVGPATNVIAALVCAFLFSTVMVSSAEPVRDNPVIVSVLENSPAHIAGLEYGDQIVSVNGVQVPNGGYANLSAPDPNTTVTVSYYHGSELRQAQVVSGVVITLTAEGLPAADAGLKQGMILTSLNGTAITNEAGFKNVLTAIPPGSTVPMTALVYNSTLSQYVDAGVTSLTTISKKDYYERNYGQTADNISYMGVSTAYLGASTSDPQVILDLLAHPFAGDQTGDQYVYDLLHYIALPFYGLQPLSSPLSEIFHPTGLFGWMPTDMFWIVANSLYWIFWINLMVGITNAMPAIPLDGGFLYRDWIDTLVAKLKKGLEQKERDRYVNSIVMTTSLFVLFLIVWQLIGPRVL